jgi:ABC-type phosphate transport system permease subunit
MDKLPVDVMQMLNALAVKLGTTMEHLWTVLVDQATIEAWLSGVWILLVVVGFLVLLSKLKRWYATADRHYDEQVAPILIGCASAIVSIIVIVRSVTVIAGVFNPEYVALNDLMSMLSKLQ